MLRRCVMLLGLSVFSAFGSRVVGFPGAGSVCTLVMAFLAALGWGDDKVSVLAIRTRVCAAVIKCVSQVCVSSTQAPVAAMVGRAWDIFQPLLFGLIGAEITVSTLDPNTVGKTCSLHYKLVSCGGGTRLMTSVSSLGDGLSLYRPAGSSSGYLPPGSLWRVHPEGEDLHLCGLASQSYCPGNSVCV